MDSSHYKPAFKSFSPVNLSSAMHSGTSDCGRLHDEIIRLVDWSNHPRFFTSQPNQEVNTCGHQDPTPDTHIAWVKALWSSWEEHEVQHNTHTHTHTHKQNEWRMAHTTRCCNNKHLCFQGMIVVRSPCEFRGCTGAPPFYRYKSWGYRSPLQSNLYRMEVHRFFLTPFSLCANIPCVIIISNHIQWFLYKRNFSIKWFSLQILSSAYILYRMVWPGLFYRMPTSIENAY